MHHAALFCWSELCEVCCDFVCVVFTAIGVSQIKQNNLNNISPGKGFLVVVVVAATITMVNIFTAS